MLGTEPSGIERGAVIRRIYAFVFILCGFVMAFLVGGLLIGLGRPTVLVLVVEVPAVLCLLAGLYYLIRPVKRDG